MTTAWHTDGRQGHSSHKAIQTSYTDTQQCGLVEVSLQNRIYILNCFHCANEFPIWDWQDFVRHMNNSHLGARMDGDAPDCAVILDTVDLAQELIAGVEFEPCMESVEHTSPLPTPSDGNESNNIEFVSTYGHCYDEAAFMNYTNEKETIELRPEYYTIERTKTPTRARSTKPPKPTARQLKAAPKEDNTDLDEVVLFEKPCDSDTLDDNESNDQDSPTNSHNCILFRSTDPAIVLHFLDLLRERAVLHTYRRLPAFPYDAAIADMTLQLNAKWRLDVRRAAVAESVMRTRYWYKYVLQRQAQMPQQYRCKFESYFERCATFLPTHDLLQPPARLNCSRCGRYFRNAIQLQNHKFIEHGEGELFYKCQQCEVRFSQPCERQQHTRSVHKRVRTAREARNCSADVTGSVCDVCGKTFTTLAICKQHRKQHDKPLYHCDQCPKSFHLSFLLKEHQRYHAQKFEFVCDECGRAFLHQRTLKQHIKGVHRRDIRCKICSIAYTNHMSVVRHLRRDHLVLEGTNEALEARSIANKIQRVLDPETHMYNYVCTICGITCSGKRPFGLVRHMMKKHGYVPIDQKWRTRKPRSSRKASQAIVDDDRNGGKAMGLDKSVSSIVLDTRDRLLPNNV